jgi:hypothetical protein
VPNGYSVNIVMQPGTSCDFSTETVKGSATTHLGIAAGGFFAPMTPGIYCFEAQHPNQAGLGSGMQRDVVWSAATSNIETIVVVAPTTSTTT